MWISKSKEEEQRTTIKPVLLIISCIPYSGQETNERYHLMDAALQTCMQDFTALENWLSQHAELEAAEHTFRHSWCYQCSWNLWQVWAALFRLSRKTSHVQTVPYASQPMMFCLAQLLGKISSCANVIDSVSGPCKHQRAFNMVIDIPKTYVFVC